METEDGHVVFTLAPHISYQADDVVMRRKCKEEHEECLVKWLLKDPEGKLTDEQKKSFERAQKEYTLWMRRDEMEACCPTLVNSIPRASTSQPAHGQGANSIPPTLESDETLREMKEDIRNLIWRVKKLMSVEGGASGGAVLASTVAVLNTYAKMGSLISVFQEHGVVDLLLDLMESRDFDVRRNASDMLHSLTSIDHDIRNYVIVQLIKSEKSPGESSPQSWQMLLDLFSERATSIESDLKGVIFPQV